MPFLENALSYVEPFSKILHEKLWDKSMRRIADTCMPMHVALPPYEDLEEDEAAAAAAGQPASSSGP